MKKEKFNEIIQKRIALCLDVLIDKANEYATDDRLHNFKVAACLQGIDPVKALAGMMAKHTVSIYDMMCSDKKYPLEMWEEKIGDHINYLLLLRTLLEDDEND